MQRSTQREQRELREPEVRPREGKEGVRTGTQRELYLGACKSHNVDSRTNRLCLYEGTPPMPVCSSEG